MANSTKKELFYELCPKTGRLLVWEGVLALRQLTTQRTWLLKQNGTEADSIEVLDIGSQTADMASEGFWQCAEIVGQLGMQAEPVFEVYYHCQNTSKASTTLSYLIDEFLNVIDDRWEKCSSRWQTLNVNINPDPFHTFNGKQKHRRLAQWQRTLRRLNINTYSVEGVDLTERERHTSTDKENVVNPANAVQHKKDTRKEEQAPPRKEAENPQPTPDSMPTPNENVKKSTGSTPKETLKSESSPEAKVTSQPKQSKPDKKGGSKKEQIKQDLRQVAPTAHVSDKVAPVVEKQEPVESKSSDNKKSISNTTSSENEPQQVVAKSEAKANTKGNETSPVPGKESFDEDAFSWEDFLTYTEPEQELEENQDKQASKQEIVNPKAEHVDEADSAFSWEDFLTYSDPEKDAGANTPAVTATYTAATETPAVTATETVATETPAVTATDTVATETPAVTATDTVATETPAVTATDTAATETPAATATDTAATETPLETKIGQKQPKSNVDKNGGTSPLKSNAIHANQSKKEDSDAPQSPTKLEKAATASASAAVTSETKDGKRSKQSSESKDQSNPSKTENMKAPGERAAELKIEQKTPSKNEQAASSPAELTAGKTKDGKRSKKSSESKEKEAKSNADPTTANREEPQEKLSNKKSDPKSSSPKDKVTSLSPSATDVSFKTKEHKRSKKTSESKEKNRKSSDELVNMKASHEKSAAKMSEPKSPSPKDQISPVSSSATDVSSKTKDSKRTKKWSESKEKQPNLNVDSDKTPNELPSTHLAEIKSGIKSASPTDQVKSSPFAADASSNTNDSKRSKKLSESKDKESKTAVPSKPTDQSKSEAENAVKSPGQPKSKSAPKKQQIGHKAEASPKLHADDLEADALREPFLSNSTQKIVVDGGSCQAFTPFNLQCGDAPSLSWAETVEAAMSERTEVDPSSIPSESIAPISKKHSKATGKKVKATRLESETVNYAQMTGKQTTQMETETTCVQIETDCHIVQRMEPRDSADVAVSVVGVNDTFHKSALTTAMSLEQNHSCTFVSTRQDDSKEADVTLAKAVSGSCKRKYYDEQPNTKTLRIFDATDVKTHKSKLRSAKSKKVSDKPSEADNKGEMKGADMIQADEHAETRDAKDIKVEEQPDMQKAVVNVCSMEEPQRSSSPLKVAQSMECNLVRMDVQGRVELCPQRRTAVSLTVTTDTVSVQTCQMTALKLRQAQNSFNYNNLLSSQCCNIGEITSEEVREYIMDMPISWRQ